MATKAKLAPILGLLLGTLLVSSAAAQTAPSAEADGWSPIGRGMMRIAGSGALSWETVRANDTSSAMVPSQTARAVSLDLTLQYFFFPRLALGITGDIGRLSYDQEGGTASGGSSHGVSIGPAITWFPGFESRRLLPYVQFMSVRGSSHDESHSANLMFSSSGSGRVSAYTGSMGVLLMLASHVGADVAVEYYEQHQTGDLTVGGDFGPPQTTHYDYRRSGTRLRLGLAVFVRP